MIFQKKGSLTWLAMVFTIALSLIVVPSIFGATGNVGFLLNEVVDDLSGGLLFDYETPLYDTTNTEQETPPLLEKIDLEVESQLNFGDIYRGKLTAGVIFDLGSVGVQLNYRDVRKGYELKSMGRSHVMSAGLTFPIGNYNVDVGIGGKNAAPWGAPNLLNDAVPLGYDEGVLEAIGAATITPAPRGLPARDFSALLLLASMGFEWDWIEGDVRLQSELTGEDKGHQAIIHLQTSKDVGSSSFFLAYEHGFLYWQGDVHAERAISIGFNRPF